jgi:uncharacterized lipoprotein NlpE involved in copper resistance
MASKHRAAVTADAVILVLVACDEMKASDEAVMA